jgi:hypothetical protein
MSQPRIITQDKRAAIICSHVAIESLPILRAVRDAPTMAEDSGWQFLCDSNTEEDPDEAKVWLIYEVLNYEPSLSAFIDEPPGTVLTRKDTASSWLVSGK